MNNEVYIISKDSGRRKEIEEFGLKFIDIDFDRSGKNPLKEFFLICKLINIYNKYQPHIVHHVTIKPALYGSIASKYARLNGSVIINAISGLGYNFIEGRDTITQKILRRLMKFAFKKNVSFIFQNPDDVALYKEFGFLNNNKYKLIKGSGVDGDLYPYTPPVKKQKIVVVVTARMLYDKGIREMIAAAHHLYEKWEGFALFQLVGDIDKGNPSAIEEKEIKDAVIPGYLEWVGHQKDVREILKLSDVVCLPSYREGLPKSLIEAMAIGRPIVTTDVPGCRECVEEGLNGYLVPAKNSKLLSDAIDKLLSDEDLRLNMGKSSRIKMEQELSLDKVVKSTLDFYEGV